jgi:hypothetical protein
MQATERCMVVRGCATSVCNGADVDAKRELAMRD